MIYVIRYLLIALYTVFWGILGCVLALINGEYVVWVGRSWISWIFKTCGLKIDVEGLENIPTDQSVVLMANHQSALDIGALVLTFPNSWRFVFKREIAYIPFFGWVMALSDQIMIDRGNRKSSVASLQKAASRVAGGVNVMIFPEGTRSLTGELKPFKSGGFHLAIDAGVPILPVTVSGSIPLTPKDSFKVESGTMKVTYGVPIPTEGLTTNDRKTLKVAVRDAIQAGFDWDYQQLPASEGDRTAAPESAHSA
jgi:1-acyl-sn-glycerol-3-phosphate acyltransferase